MLVTKSSHICFCVVSCFFFIQRQALANSLKKRRTRTQPKRKKPKRGDECDEEDENESEEGEEEIEEELDETE